MGAPYDHTSSDCRCLIWFKTAAEGFIGSSDGNELISSLDTKPNSSETKNEFAFAAGMRRYVLHCQVNYEHQLSFYNFED
jgi:hypothetical protein